MNLSHVRPRGVRRIAAIELAAAARLLARGVGHGGTSLPGLIAERVDPMLVRDLAGALGQVILVVGTNGKTTTARLIGRILRESTGSWPIANRSGANLRQGIASSLSAAAGHRGRLRRPGQAAVFEVDELALESILATIQPSTIVATNLFRDQLDRYGEVDAIVARWRAAFGRLEPKTILVLCSDDPRVEQLAREGLRTIRFGLDPAGDPTDTMASVGTAGPMTAADDPASDPVACPHCHETLVFGWRSIGHLGDYACPAGHIARPTPDVAVAIEPSAVHRDFDDASSAATRFVFSGDFGRASADIHLAGASGAYDAGAAVAAAIACGIEPVRAIRDLAGATPAFGRLEEVLFRQRRVVLALAKNPASLTESEAIAARRHPDAVLLGLSDEAADGRDVSWIWDVEFDPLVDVPMIGLTGNRADDLALRLKYSRRRAGDRWPVVTTEPVVDRALETMLGRIPPGGTLVVLATYTALLGIRRSLQRRGVVAAIPR